MEPAVPESPASNDGSLEDLKHNLATVRARMDAAAMRAGRDPAEISLLPVSKTFGEARLRQAYVAGCRILGENKVQEAAAKSAAMADLTDLRWAVIGHLQTNKAGAVARFASEFHALDSLRVARALERRLEAEDRTLDVFVQVNTSGEESKYGLAPGDAPTFVRELPAFPRLKVRGLMTLAVFSAEDAVVRPCFVLLRRLRDELREIDPRVSELSMGMSGDFEIAIEEGATTVRVGQAIFGPRGREFDEQHYWPSAAAQEKGTR